MAGRNTGDWSVLSQGQLLPSRLCHFMSWELGLTTVRLGGTKHMIRQDCGLHAICDYIWTGRAVGCTPFAARALLPVASSQVNCPSLSFLGYLWERLWIVTGWYVWDPLLGPWCSILLGTFTACPSWNLRRYSKEFGATQFQLIFAQTRKNFNMPLFNPFPSLIMLLWLFYLLSLSFHLSQISVPTFCWSFWLLFTLVPNISTVNTMK